MNWLWQQPGTYVVLITMCVALVYNIVRMFQPMPSDEELESKRTEELIQDARAHYPGASSTFNAITLYLTNIQTDINLLKKHNAELNAPEVYVMILRDRRLLQQERARLAQIEAELNCDYQLIPTN